MTREEFTFIAGCTVLGLSAFLAGGIVPWLAFGASLLWGTIVGPRLIDHERTRRWGR